MILDLSAPEGSKPKITIAEEHRHADQLDERNR
jgi:hypothetical protein